MCKRCFGVVSTLRKEGFSGAMVESSVGVGYRLVSVGCLVGSRASPAWILVESSLSDVVTALCESL